MCVKMKELKLLSDFFSKVFSIQNWELFNSEKNCTLLFCWKLQKIRFLFITDFWKVHCLLYDIIDSKVLFKFFEFMLSNLETELVLSIFNSKNPHSHTSRSQLVMLVLFSKIWKISNNSSIMHFWESCTKFQILFYN